MTQGNTAWRIGIRIVLLFAALFATAFILIKGWFPYLLIAIPVTIYLSIELYRFHKKTHDELQQFVEAVHYRDFSRHFDIKHAPVDLQPLRKGFNEINTTFKTITREKETQYQYLQKILELVDTGILSYEEQGGEVVWMNESLKRMLQLPYLKTIHSMEKRDAALYQDIIALKPGEGKITTAQPEAASFKILLSATSFQTEAWQKLLSVMTHEIMNSVAPISSLADTLKNRLQQSAPLLKHHPGAVDDLELGIETIKRRSEGLLKFAETYRNLNKITTLNLTKVYVRDLFENLHRLMQPTLEQKEIELEIILKDPDLMLEADTNLVEQVLINLVVNAIEAVKSTNQPRIILAGYQSGNGKTIIKVADNGLGIPAEIMDKIFIPFFSTKKHGSGIGLSLCKQIMMLHRGNIQVQSATSEGTVFMLLF